jgi:ApaG protein
MTDPSSEVVDLTVSVDRIIYRRGGPSVPEETPHVFVYFLTIRNDSDRTVTLLGRKWVVGRENGERTVIEGDKIVGQTPTIAPGEHFSYNSYHLVPESSTAVGSFHGVDEFNNKVHARIPSFMMKIPD